MQLIKYKANTGIVVVVAIDISQFYVAHSL